MRTGRNWSAARPPVRTKGVMWESQKWAPEPAPEGKAFGVPRAAQASDRRTRAALQRWWCPPPRTQRERRGKAHSASGGGSRLFCRRCAADGLVDLGDRTLNGFIVQVIDHAINGASLDGGGKHVVTDAVGGHALGGLEGVGGFPLHGHHGHVVAALACLAQSFNVTVVAMEWE